MNDNKIKGKINIISLKKKNKLFFKKFEPNKVANNYLYNIRKNSTIKRPNNALKISQKYLLKISDLSKLSELNSISKANQINNGSNNVNQTLPNQLRNQKLLNFKKINNIKNNIKLKYKSKLFTSLLAKINDSSLKNETTNIKSNNSSIRKNNTILSYEERSNNLNSFVINNNAKKRNIKKIFNKKITDVFNYFNINDRRNNNTFENNLLNKNIYANSNNKIKEISERMKKEYSSLEGDSLKNINLIKESNERLFNKVLLNKNNRNININIKYFYKKNIKNVNCIFYNTINNINSNTIILKKKDNKNTKMFNNYKKEKEKEKEKFQHGKSPNDINIINYSSGSQKINLIKNKFNQRNKPNILNSYRYNMSKRNKMKINKLNDIFSHKNIKTNKLINSNLVNNLLTKYKSLKKNNKFQFNTNPFKQNNEYFNNSFKNNRKIKSENNLNLKKNNNKIDKKTIFTNRANINIINNINEESKYIKTDKNIKSNTKPPNNKNAKPKKQSNILFLKNKFDIKSIYKKINSKFGLKEKKENENKIKNEPNIIKKKQYISKKESRINYINLYKYNNYSNSDIEDMINSDENLSNIKNNFRVFDGNDLESITKKLNFDNYNILNCGNIFNLENNKEYDEYINIFDKQFNTKFNIFKIVE